MARSSTRSPRVASSGAAGRVSPVAFLREGLDRILKETFDRFVLIG